MLNATNYLHLCPVKDHAGAVRTDKPQSFVSSRLKYSGWLACNVGGLPSRRWPPGAGPGPGLNETCESHIPCTTHSSEPNSRSQSSVEWDRPQIAFTRIQTNAHSTRHLPRVDPIFKVTYLLAQFTRCTSKLKLRLSDLNIACMLTNPQTYIQPQRRSLFVDLVLSDALCIVSPCCQDHSAQQTCTSLMMHRLPTASPSDAGRLGTCWRCRIGARIRGK